MFALGFEALSRNNHGYRHGDSALHLERQANGTATRFMFLDVISKPATADQNPSVLRGYETRMETMRTIRKDILGVHVEGIPSLNIPPAESDWWGALNTITAWSDHLQTTGSDRYAHLLLGSGDKLKATALARIQATTGVDYAVAP